MREIKFRAWDKVCGEMVRDEWKLFLNGGVSIMDAWSTKDVILMQYTNLKDKNGKEIYEGDIVEYTARVTHEGKVFHNVIEYYEQCNNCGFIIIGKDKRCRNNLCFDQIYNHSIKVIGNIYENPELLESLNENDTRKQSSP